MRLNLTKTEARRKLREVIARIAKVEQELWRAEQARRFCRPDQREGKQELEDAWREGCRILYARKADLELVIEEPPVIESEWLFRLALTARDVAIDEARARERSVPIHRGIVHTPRDNQAARALREA